MAKSLEEKNKDLTEKINKISEMKNLSVLDHKLLYGKTDKTL